MSLEEVLAEVAKFEAQYVCVTGGEPLGQRGTIELLHRLLKNQYTVSLETNGSFSIEDVPSEVMKIVDIKCPDSGEVESFHEENLNLVQAHDQFKFVVASEADFRWARELSEKHKLDKKCTVLFSPVYGKVSPKELANWILDDRAPATMQTQMHKEIWGPKERGV